MAAAESTVWCAEEDGALTIREKDGTVCGVVERPPQAPAVTALCFVPGSFGSARVVVGHEDGTLVAVDAAKGERRSGDVRAHDGAVTALGVAGPAAASAVISCGADGAVLLFDPFGIEAPLCLGQHSGAARAVTAAARRIYSGGDDSAVRAWDPAAAARGAAGEAASAAVDGPVSDLLLSGRYLWVALQTGPVLVLDSAELSTVAVLGGDADPAPPAPRLALCGQHVWAFPSAAGSGPFRLWNCQTLASAPPPPASTPAEAEAAGEAAAACLRVPTVPEDSELWVAGTGSLRMWRDHEYVLPLWCVEAAEEARQQLEDARRDAERLRADAAALRVRWREEQERANAADGVRDRLQEELAALRRDTSRGLAQEAERRKRADAQLGELRQMLVAAQRQLFPERAPQAHYSMQDLRVACAALASLAERGLQCEDEESYPAADAHRLRLMGEDNAALRRALDAATRRADEAERQAQQEDEGLRARVQQMEEQAAGLERRLRLALTRVAGLEEERTQLAAEADAARGHADELEKALRAAPHGGGHALAARVAELQRERDELLTAQAELSDELAEVRLVQPRLGELAQPSAAAAAAASAAALVSELREQLHHTEAEAASARAAHDEDVANLRSALAEEEARRAAAERSLHALQLRVAETRETQCENTDVAVRLRAELAEKTAQLEAARRACAAAEAGTAEQARRAEELAALLRTEQDGRRDCDSRLQQLQGEVAQLDGALQSARAESRGVRERAESAERRAEDAARRAEASDAHAAATQEALRRAEAEVEQLRRQCSQPREELQQVRNRLAGAEARSSMMEDEISDLTQRKETLEKEAADLRAAKERAEAGTEQTIEQLTAERAAALREAEELRRAAAELERANSELRERGENSTEVAGLRSRAAALESDKRRLEEDKGRLKEMLGKLKTAQTRVNEQLRAMGSQLEERDRYISELLDNRKPRLD